MSVEGLWRLKLEKQRNKSVYTIIRYIKSASGTLTSERLPIKKYALIRENVDELNKLVDRLNYDILKAKKSRDSLAFKHAFIDEELLEEFKSLLITQIPSRDRALTNFHYLKTHVLTYFIQTLNLANPRDWYLVSQTKWGEYLIKNKAIVAPATKREVIQIANRFIKFLHSKRPDEVPMYRFEPISAAVFKKMIAQRKVDKEGADRKFIKDEHWAMIKTKLPDSIKPAALLAYHYGLRRSETLGVQIQDVKKGYLELQRQLVKLKPKPSFGPLKGREARKINHWLTTPENAYKWVKATQANLIHPDTLSDIWREVMETLKLDYDFHDLRHSFITKALAEYPPRQVQLAAGHKSIETTMKYAHDHRQLNDEQFNPEEDVA